MRTYSVTNFPPEYRAFFLKKLMHDYPKQYGELKAKAEEAIQKGIKKTKTLNRDCVNLTLYEDGYIKDTIKAYESDEEIDKVFRERNVSYADVIKRLPEEQQELSQSEIHACLFALDILDTHIRNVNKFIKQALGANGEDNMFHPIIELAERCNNILSAFHRVQSETFEQDFADEAERIDSYIVERSKTYHRKQIRKCKK